MEAPRLEKLSQLSFGMQVQSPSHPAIHVQYVHSNTWVDGLLALYVCLTAVEVRDRAFVKVEYVRRIGQEHLRLSTVQVAFFGGGLPSLHLRRKQSLSSNGTSTREVFRSNYDG